MIVILSVVLCLLADKTVRLWQGRDNKRRGTDILDLDVLLNYFEDCVIDFRQVLVWYLSPYVKKLKVSLKI